MEGDTSSGLLLAVCCIRSSSVSPGNKKLQQLRIHLSVSLRNILDPDQGSSALGPSSKGGKSITRGRQIKIAVTEHPMKSQIFIKDL